jgi:putative membrane protein
MMGLGLGIGGFGLIFMVLFWGGLIVLAIWLIGQLFPSAKSQSNDGSTSTSAQEILKTRYARGELTPAQYQEMSQIIQK